ncbi:hypothetical protein QQZ08_009499 [Neonectria magnoliae]|uniref:B30.2/SPRY domain-containing protein n=1 Tax=Neonectria magnoliae TaxID=2732573 RepID=A0ABR1HNQ8_9HYPO
MAAQITTETRSHDDYTVGWVCALPKEQTAATAMLDHRHAGLPKPPNDSMSSRTDSYKKRLRRVYQKLSMECTFLLAQIYLGLLADKLTLNEIGSAMEAFRRQGQGLGEDQKDQVLDSAYEQTMKRINRQMPGMKTLAMKVLLWITCAKRQLTTSELQYALATKTEKSELDHGDLPHIGDMVSVCAGLVTVNEESGVIRLVHYTTQEYLKQTQERWFQDPESIITITCATYLSLTVFETGFCETDHEFEERLRSNPFYDYAAHNWGHHAPKDKTPNQVISFLISKAKVEASSQALTAAKIISYHTGYSQEAPRKMTGLHLAGCFGASEVADALLRLGHSPDLKDTHSCTPLWYAAQKGHKAVVKLLAVAGTDVNTATNFGRTALQAAADRGHLEVIEKLLAAGADVNAAAAAYDGRTALRAAAERGHLEIVEKLLEHVNGESLTDNEILKLTDATDALNGLAPFEAFITRALERNTWKMIKNPYHRAVLAGSSNVVQALKKHGVNPTGLDEDNWSCVDYATRLGRLSLLDSLREHFQQHARAEHARPEHGFPTTLLWSDFEHSVLIASCSTSNHQECTGIHKVQVHEKADGLNRVCIRSKRCVPPPSASNKHFYFEVTILKDSISRILGLGFCGEDIGRNQMPGWFDGSWAYHGDNGKLFIGSDYEGVVPTPDFGAPGEFSAGDVVGACLNLETGEGFCTLNGKKMNMGNASKRMKFKVVKIILPKRTYRAFLSSSPSSTAKATANFRKHILLKSLSKLNTLLAPVLTVLYDDMRHEHMATGMLRSLFDSESADVMINTSLRGSVLNPTLAIHP